MDRSIRDDLDQWDAHIQKLNVMYQLHSDVNKVVKENNNNEDSSSDAKLLLTTVHMRLVHAQTKRESCCVQWLLQSTQSTH
jgi:hypothetical protein